jgi:hypothetical protein
MTDSVILRPPGRSQFNGTRTRAHSSRSSLAAALNLPAALRGTAEHLPIGQCLDLKQDPAERPAWLQERSLRKGGGPVDAPGRWLVGAKGNYPC